MFRVVEGSEVYLTVLRISSPRLSLQTPLRSIIVWEGPFVWDGAAAATLLRKSVALPSTLVIAFSRTQRESPDA